MNINPLIQTPLSVPTFGIPGFSSPPRLRLSCGLHLTHDSTVPPPSPPQEERAGERRPFNAAFASSPALGLGKGDRLHPNFFTILGLLLFLSTNSAPAQQALAPQPTSSTLASTTRIIAETPYA